MQPSSDLAAKFRHSDKTSASTLPTAISAVLALRTGEGESLRLALPATH